MALAREQEISLALCGGYALQLYGSPRLTGDVDFCADGIVSGLKRGAWLSFGGQQVVASNGVVVDLIVRDDNYAALYQDALESSVRLRGVKAPVTRLEHLLAMKLEAQRDKDLADLSFIVSETKFDLNRARRIVREFVGGEYAVRDLNGMIEQARYHRNRKR